MEKRITLPLTAELAKTLHAGDRVLLTGTIYTSRDAGHKRMCEALARGEKIPFDPTDATIYYVGPTPAKPGHVIGSAGPKKAELNAYEDLGAEALRKLYVEDMPLVVIIDSEGNNLYEEGRAEYLAEHKAHEAEKNA